MKKQLEIYWHPHHDGINIFFILTYTATRIKYLQDSIINLHADLVISECFSV